jgi:hypothetical protein
MSWLGDVLWADCIRALRVAGFVCAAESPTAVVLVSAGRSVLIPRVPALDERALLATLRATRLSGDEFLALLGRGRGERPPLPSSTPPDSVVGRVLVASAGEAGEGRW